jgi:ABC-type uncharacterized transport system substrate-binding protein
LVHNQNDDFTFDEFDVNAGDFVQQGEEIADIGMKVLNGKSPADIPLRKLSQIKTVINIEAALA